MICAGGLNSLKLKKMWTRIDNCTQHDSVVVAIGIFSGSGGRKHLDLLQACWWLTGISAIHTGWSCTKISDGGIPPQISQRPIYLSLMFLTLINENFTYTGIVQGAFKKQKKSYLCLNSQIICIKMLISMQCFVRLLAISKLSKCCVRYVLFVQIPKDFMFFAVLPTIY